MSTDAITDIEARRRRLEAWEASLRAREERLNQQQQQQQQQQAITKADNYQAHPSAHLPPSTHHNIFAATNETDALPHTTLRQHEDAPLHIFISGVLFVTTLRTATFGTARYGGRSEPHYLSLRVAEALSARRAAMLPHHHHYSMHSSEAAIIVREAQCKYTSSHREHCDGNANCLNDDGSQQSLLYDPLTIHIAGRSPDLFSLVLDFLTLEMRDFFAPNAVTEDLLYGNGCYNLKAEEKGVLHRSLTLTEDPTVTSFSEHLHTRVIPALVANNKGATANSLQSGEDSRLVSVAQFLSAAADEAAFYGLCGLGREIESVIAGLSTPTIGAAFRQLRSTQSTPASTTTSSSSIDTLSSGVQEAMNDQPQQRKQHQDQARDQPRVTLRPPRATSTTMVLCMTLHTCRTVGGEECNVYPNASSAGRNNTLGGNCDGGGRGGASDGQQRPQTTHFRRFLFVGCSDCRVSIYAVVPPSEDGGGGKLFCLAASFPAHINMVTALVAVDIPRRWIPTASAACASRASLVPVLVTAGRDGRLCVWDLSQLAAQTLRKGEGSNDNNHDNAKANFGDSEDCCNGCADAEMEPLWRPPLLKRVRAHHGYIQSMIVLREGGRAGTEGCCMRLRTHFNVPSAFCAHLRGTTDSASDGIDFDSFVSMHNASSSPSSFSKTSSEAVLPISPATTVLIATGSADRYVKVWSLRDVLARPSEIDINAPLALVRDEIADPHTTLSDSNLLEQRSYGDGPSAVPISPQVTPSPHPYAAQRHQDSPSPLLGALTTTRGGSVADLSAMHNSPPAISLAADSTANSFVYDVRGNNRDAASAQALRHRHNNVDITIDYQHHISEDFGDLMASAAPPAQQQQQQLQHEHGGEHAQERQRQQQQSAEAPRGSPPQPCEQHEGHTLMGQQQLATEDNRRVPNVAARAVYGEEDERSMAMPPAAVVSGTVEYQPSQVHTVRHLCGSYLRVSQRRESSTHSNGTTVKNGDGSQKKAELPNSTNPLVLALRMPAPVRTMAFAFPRLICVGHGSAVSLVDLSLRRVVGGITPRDEGPSGGLMSSSHQDEEERRSGGAKRSRSPQTDSGNQTQASHALRDGSLHPAEANAINSTSTNDEGLEGLPTIIPNSTFEKLGLAIRRRALEERGRGRRRGESTNNTPPVGIEVGDVEIHEEHSAEAAAATTGEEEDALRCLSVAAINGSYEFDCHSQCSDGDAAAANAPLPRISRRGKTAVLVGTYWSGAIRLWDISPELLQLQRLTTAPFRPHLHVGVQQERPRQPRLLASARIPLDRSSGPQGGPHWASDAIVGSIGGKTVVTVAAGVTVANFVLAAKRRFACGTIVTTKGKNFGATRHQCEPLYLVRAGEEAEDNTLTQHSQNIRCILRACLCGCYSDNNVAANRREVTTVVVSGAFDGTVRVTGQMLPLQLRPLPFST